MAKAVRKGNLAKVKAMLADGFDANQPYIFGETLLMDAAYRGHVEVARALIQAGANVNVRATSTALSEGAFQGHLPILELLLKSGANPNLTDRRCALR